VKINKRVCLIKSLKRKNLFKSKKKRLNNSSRGKKLKMPLKSKDSEKLRLKWKKSNKIDAKGERRENKGKSMIKNKFNLKQTQIVEQKLMKIQASNKVINLHRMVSLRQLICRISDCNPWTRMHQLLNSDKFTDYSQKIHHRQHQPR